VISRIHGKLGTAGFIISIVALVAALGGGAYAASGGLSGKQKKEVEKIAKKYAGKPGATGATGAAGPAGAKGDTGAAGAAGNDGANGGPGQQGQAGSPGVNGKSVVVATEAKGANCAEGGASVEVEGSGSKKYVCNGKEGKEGKSGFASELPAGETESGAWSFGAEIEVEEEFSRPIVQTTISFPFTLPAGEGEGSTPVAVEYLPEGAAAGSNANCPGTSEAPLAEEGFLCVYASPGSEFEINYFGAVNPNSATTGSAGSGRSGAILEFKAEPFSKAHGTWAVTARA
jgi:Collagen triple helix repeat (20 copies)